MSEWTRPAQPVRCVVELDKPLAVHRERGVLAQGDANANAIVAEVYSTAGKPYDLSGCTVQLIFVRQDNNALPAINAEISGNTATATLPDSAYAMSGMYSLRMQLRKNGAERTIVWIIGEVKGTDVDGIADPENVISIGDIMASAKEAQTAASNANAAAQRANAGAERAEQLQIDASGLAGDSNKLGGKPPEYYLPAVNLLDNSDWRAKENIINQRGGTLYTGDGNKPVYSIDRWYTWGVGATLTVNSASITIAGSPFLQNVPLNRFTAGKTYTYVCKLKDGTLRIAKAQYGSNAGGTAYKIYLEWVGSSGIGYRIYLYEGEFEWAALYEGVYTAETLPPFVPPDPTIEFAKCRMCFREYDTGLDLTSYANGYLSGIPFDMPMRVAPTITECVVVDARLAQYLDVNIRTSATSKNGVMYINVPDAIYQSIYRVERLVLAADL